MIAKGDTIIEASSPQLRSVYARYLQAKSNMAVSRGASAYSMLTADLLALVGDDTQTHTSLLTFNKVRPRMGSRAAIVFAVAGLLGHEFPAEMDSLLMAFLLDKAGLDEHPLRGAIEALAHKVGQENDWGAQIVRFAEGVLALQQEREREE